MRSRLHAALTGAVIGALLTVFTFGPKLEAQQAGYLNWVNQHAVALKADFTDGSGVTTLQNITGLVMTFPAGYAATYQIDCDLMWSQATNVADSFGFQFAGNSPSNAEFGGITATNATTYASGPAVNITNTTATAVITGTPAVATVLYAHMGGSVEIAGNAVDTTLQVVASQATAANVIVVKRGSICRWSQVA